MKYTRYGTLSVFRDDWEPLLAQDEVVANLFFANLTGEDTRAQGLWAGSIEGEGGLLLSIRRGEYGMVLYHKGGVLADLCARLVKGLHDDDYWPELFIGPKETVGGFIRQVREQEGRKYEAIKDMRVYKLTGVKPVPEAKGRFSRIDKVRDYLIDYDMAFQKIALNPMTREEAEEHIRGLIDGKKLYGWLVRDRYVYMALKARKTPHGQFVSLVYTPPEERGKGYATACVAALSRMLLREGNGYCGLFTDLSNPISNHIYMKMGYEPVCDFTLYKLRRD
jgi:GNAT superfamily N-acetyltransferase